MTADLTVGGLFPDITLPDHVGNERRLSELAGDDPMLLQFYRGWWCPKEQAFFRNLVTLQAEAEVAYTRFVSVSVDAPEVQAAFRAGIGARWPFLSDENRVCVEKLGLMETADSAHRPYLPTVFTLGPGLTIHQAYNGYWFWGRPTNEELRRDFRAISEKIRSDWQPPSS